MTPTRIALLCLPCFLVSTSNVCAAEAALETRRPAEAGAAPSQAQPDPRSEHDRGTGWARAAGIYGLVAAAAVIGLAAASEATAEHQIPALPIGAVGTAIAAATVPAVAAGGASARHSLGVTGSRPLRIVGWTSFGIMLVEAATLIGIGAVGTVSVPKGVIISTGLIGATSIGCFAADAFLSASQAERAARSQRPARATFAPSVGWTRAADDSFALTLGGRGSF